jgi:ferredoxin-type protein NapH
MAYLKKTLLPLSFLGLFFGIAIWRYAATGKVFYLLNFGYIGFALALGIFLSAILPKRKLATARRVAQLLIGIYLLVYVGIVAKEDLQIEGFWFYLFSGYFAGATLHYFIAKIVGPLVFNRGWCGWACWTAMVLDMLPWKRPVKPIARKLSHARYIHFALVFIAVAALFFLTEYGRSFRHREGVELLWLLIGNLVYYAIGIILAALLKDNRAFCKYLCPIPSLMKVGARYSLLKNEIDAVKCVECGKCEQNCPMQIPILHYKKNQQRISSTECILCQTCESVCPKDAIKMTFRIDKRRGGWTLRL